MLVLLITAAGTMPSLDKKPSLVRLNEHVDCDRGQVTDSHLIRSRVLNNFCAEVRALDGPKILLVALPVASILVQHEVGASLYLTHVELGRTPPSGQGSPSSCIKILLIYCQ